MRVSFVVGQVLGHVGRALNVARALRACRRCDITFVGNNPKQYLERYVSPDGFAIAPISMPDPSPGSYAISLADTLSRVKPDIVVYDLSPIPWLMFAAAPAVPQVYLTNYFVTRLGSERTSQDEAFDTNKTYINAHRQRLGLSLINSAREFYEKDRVILADPQQLLPNSPALPANFTCAGAIWWEPESELPPDLREQRGILYVSLGSTGAHVPRAALARIATKIDARHVVVASTKGSDDHTRVSVPISYHANLPGSEVLKRSSLAITQGGAGSSYQALGAKVPLGIWPAHRNHQLLGERLTQLGLAFPLHSRPLETAIDDFLRDRSEIMERLSRFTGMDSAVASLAAAAVIGELF